MTDLTPEQIAELRRLLDAATPGEWLTKKEGWHMAVVSPTGQIICNDESYYPTAVDHNDMEFIAAAKNDLPSLLDERDRLMGLLRRHHEMRLGDLALRDETIAALGDKP